MSSISGGVGGSSIGGVSSVDGSGVRGSGNNSDIVGVSGSIGIVDWESSSDLSDGVGISIRVSLTLAIVVSSIPMDSRGGVSMDTRVSVSSMSVGGRGSVGGVSSVDRGRVGGAGHNSDIVGVSSGISVVDWESSSDLSDGVSISIRVSLSLTLAIVVSGVSVDGGGWDNAGVDRGSSNNSRVGSRGSNNMVSIAKVSNTSIANMSSIGTVTNGSDTANNTVRVVDTSHDTSEGASSSDLTNGVGVAISEGSGGQEDKCESSHLDSAEQSS